MRVTTDRQAGISGLIGQVYDAALNPNLWSGLAAEASAALASTSAQVYVRNARRGTFDRLMTTSNYEGIDHERYASYYAERDILVQRATRLGMSKVVASKDLVSDTEFERTEFYQDWVRTIGIFYIVGSVFPVSDDAVGVVGVHRPRAAGTYDEDDKALVAQFLPHLQRALQIRHRLADPTIERGASLDALARSGTAMLVVGRDGRVLYANDGAEVLLRSGDGVRLVDGRLAVDHRDTAARLTGLIQAAVDAAAGRHGGGPGGAMAIGRTDRLPLTLLVAPFRPAREGLGAPMPAAILFLRDPEAPTPGRAALQGLFGLTAAEAAVAAEVADGKSIDGLAARLGIRVNTARTHLRNVFAKTGTNRQAELVALVLRSAAGLE